MKLIRLWLEAPVVEEGEPGEGKGRAERSKKGTPQGGVISPLLANLYLHWFDKVFLRHRASPARGGSAKLVRYADDFVVMMRGRDVALEAFIEERLEARMGLKLNREKTRVVELREEGASLEFLGYLFRWERDRHGRAWKYLNVSPSKKSIARERARLREMISRSQSHVPLALVIGRLNRQMRGWANYFSRGYPRGAYWELDWYVRERLVRHPQLLRLSPSGSSFNWKRGCRGKQSMPFLNMLKWFDTAACADRRPPRIDADLTHFCSPRGEKRGLTLELLVESL